MCRCGLTAEMLQKEEVCTQDKLHPTCMCAHWGVYFNTAHWEYFPLDHCKQFPISLNVHQKLNPDSLWATTWMCHVHLGACY